MKKYKLIKKYPGSPELGTIIETREVLDYPEFWEEIVEYPVGTKVIDTESVYPLAHIKGNIFEKTNDGWKPYNFPVENMKGELPESLIGKGKRFEVIEEKKPLLTTEDGVDIYEGDKVYLVLEPEWQYNLLEKNITEKEFKNTRESIKWFASKEKAEEYILMNKPFICINDLTKEFPHLKEIEGDLIKTAKLNNFLNNRTQN